MNTIFNDVCLLVTGAFAFTLVLGFRQPVRSLLSRRDQGTALAEGVVKGSHLNFQQFLDLFYSALQ